MKKKGGNWYSYLSGSQSTLKIHVADMKTPLLKSANHIKVCHVAFVKWLFIFISIYAKMKNPTKSTWCSFLRLLFTCGTHNFSHLYKTAVLREWQGQGWLEVIAGSKRLQLERGKEVESQVVVRFQCLKIHKRTRVIYWQETGHDRIWFGWDETVFSAWCWLH